MFKNPLVHSPSGAESDDSFEIVGGLLDSEASQATPSDSMPIPDFVESTTLVIEHLTPHLKPNQRAAPTLDFKDANVTLKTICALVASLIQQENMALLTTKAVATSLNKAEEAFLKQLSQGIEKHFNLEMWMSIQPQTFKHPIIKALFYFLFDKWRDAYIKQHPICSQEDKPNGVQLPNAGTYIDLPTTEYERTEFFNISARANQVLETLKKQRGSHKIRPELIEAGIAYVLSFYQLITQRVKLTEVHWNEIKSKINNPNNIYYQAFHIREVEGFFNFCHSRWEEQRQTVRSMEGADKWYAPYDGVELKPITLNPRTADADADADAPADVDVAPHNSARNATTAPSDSDSEDSDDFESFTKTRLEEPAFAHEEGTITVIIPESAQAIITNIETTALSDEASAILSQLKHAITEKTPLSLQDWNRYCTNAKRKEVLAQQSEAFKLAFGAIYDLWKESFLGNFTPKSSTDGTPIPKAYYTGYPHELPYLKEIDVNQFDTLIQQLKKLRFNTVSFIKIEASISLLLLLKTYMNTEMLLTEQDWTRLETQCRNFDANNPYYLALPIQNILEIYHSIHNAWMSTPQYLIVQAKEHKTKLNQSYQTKVTNFNSGKFLRHISTSFFAPKEPSVETQFLDNLISLLEQFDTATLEQWHLLQATLRTGKESATHESIYQLFYESYDLWKSQYLCNFIRDNPLVTPANKDPARLQIPPLFVQTTSHSPGLNLTFSASRVNFASTAMTALRESRHKKPMADTEAKLSALLFLTDLLSQKTALSLSEYQQFNALMMHQNSNTPFYFQFQPKDSISEFFTETYQTFQTALRNQTQEHMRAENARPRGMR